MAKRVLIIKGGTMRGAFVVGALKTVHRMLGVNYFDAIFATSVGVFEQAFFASGQIHFMENTWRKYVHGRQLINFFNPLQGKPILNLDYLIDLFQSDKSMLDIQAFENSKPQLFTFVTDYKTKEPTLLNFKNGPIFDVMRATSAVPFFYPKKVIINGRRYIDSWVLPEKKFKQFIKQSLGGYDEILMISTYSNNQEQEEFKNIIKPSKMPLWGALDTNRERIIETIKQGEVDAEKFIKENILK